jgi:hypothetical protein
MKEHSYLPETIIAEKDKKNNSIMFLINGHITAFGTRISFSPYILQDCKGNIFKGKLCSFKEKGDLLNGIFQQESSSWLKSDDLANVIYIEHREFLDLLTNYPADYELYLQLIKE